MGTMLGTTALGSQSANSQHPTFNVETTLPYICEALSVLEHCVNVLCFRLKQWDLCSHLHKLVMLGRVKVRFQVVLLEGVGFAACDLTQLLQLLQDLLPLQVLQLLQLLLLAFPGL